MVTYDKDQSETTKAYVQRASKPARRSASSATEAEQFSHQSNLTPIKMVSKLTAAAPELCPASTRRFGSFVNRQPCSCSIHGKISSSIWRP
jgi:hypothetical protein